MPSQLHHLAGIGTILEAVFEEPVNEECYDKVRSVLYVTTQSVTMMTLIRLPASHSQTYSVVWSQVWAQLQVLVIVYEAKSIVWMATCKLKDNSTSLSKVNLLTHKLVKNIAYCHRTTITLDILPTTRTCSALMQTLPTVTTIKIITISRVNMRLMVRTSPCKDKITMPKTQSPSTASQRKYSRTGTGRLTSPRLRGEGLLFSSPRSLYTHFAVKTDMVKGLA
jgi:hypothetical protein